MSVLFEIIGYIGTALVILSMTMTSVRRLRAINVLGSAFSTAYAIFGGAWPIVIMNVTLSGVNIFHLIHGAREERCEIFPVAPSDRTLAHFLDVHRSRIQRMQPDVFRCMEQGAQAYILYKGAEMSGILVALSDGATLVAAAYARSRADRAMLSQYAEQIAREGAYQTLLTQNSCSPQPQGHARGEGSCCNHSSYGKENET